MAPLLNDVEEEEDSVVSALDQARLLVSNWSRRIPEAIEEVRELLACAQLTMDAVVASTFPEHLDAVERIEHLTETAEARRNRVLREIDYHRSAVADHLRQTLNIAEGEYKVIESSGQQAA